MMQIALGNLSCHAIATGVNNSALLSPGKKINKRFGFIPWVMGGSSSHWVDRSMSTKSSHLVYKNFEPARQAIAASIPAAGMVTIHAQTIRPATAQRTALILSAAPTPTIDPVMV